MEIIVSDNASLDGKTEMVVKEFMVRDSRIQYIRQSKNIGAFQNFQFVLKKASGVFFMWAADDDEWDATFVDFCVRNIGASGSIMTAFQIKNRSRNDIVRVDLPLLSGGRRCRKDVSSFVKNMQPSMFYGLHRRNLLSFIFNQKEFDWFDCYVCMRMIWDYGYECRNDVSLYTAGIDSECYVVKPCSGSKLRPFKYFIYSMKYIIFSGNIITFSRHLSILFMPNIRAIVYKWKLS